MVFIFKDIHFPGVTVKGSLQIYNDMLIHQTLFLLGKTDVQFCTYLFVLVTLDLMMVALWPSLTCDLKQMVQQFQFFIKNFMHFGNILNIPTPENFLVKRCILASMHFHGALKNIFKNKNMVSKFILICHELFKTGK